MSSQQIADIRETLRLHEMEMRRLDKTWRPICELFDAELVEAKAEALWALRQWWEAQDKAAAWGRKK